MYSRSLKLSMVHVMHLESWALGMDVEFMFVAGFWFGTIPVGASCHPKSSSCRAGFVDPALLGLGASGPDQGRVGPRLPKTTLLVVFSGPAVRT